MVLTRTQLVIGDRNAVDDKPVWATEGIVRGSNGNSRLDLASGRDEGDR